MKLSKTVFFWFFFLKMWIAAPKKYIAPMEVAIKSFQYNRKNIAFLNWISNYCGNSCCEIRVSSKWNQNNQFFIANQKYTSRQMFVSGRGENSKSQGYTGFSYFFMKLWYFFYETIGFFVMKLSKTVIIYW